MTFDALRKNEFGRLDASGQVYLDYTGSGLYPESLVREHAERLCGSVLGNPHSRNPTSSASTELVAGARRRVLEFFRADPDEYEIIFTLNASGALKLVGESYPFGPDSRLRLTTDNHNSVNGLREFASGHGADVRYIRLDPDLRIQNIERELDGAEPSASNLFAFPAKSNFSGVKHPLSWIRAAHDRGYDVLLDAAAYVPTNRLDLSVVRPEFVTVSFYKMFGYPTGVGALVARRDALEKLHRPWFSGGTVRFVSAQNNVRILYQDSKGFEDGTVNFLSLGAIPSGLNFLDELGMDRIADRVSRLTDTLLEGMRSLVHSNGNPLVRVYGPRTMEGRGGTIACNLLDPDGRAVDCLDVEKAATAAGISLRTGYFCNPGAAETSFELPDDEALECYDELAGNEFTLHQFSACLQDKPIGAVRLSLGIATNEEDVRRCLELLETFRDRVVVSGAAAREAVG